MPYLLKTEPDKYSYDDLLRDGETTWDGISNNQALLILRNMKKGEKLVIYHSNVGKAAMGTAKVVSGRRVRPAQSAGPHQACEKAETRKAASRNSRSSCVSRLDSVPSIPPLRRPSDRRTVRLADPYLRGASIGWVICDSFEESQSSCSLQLKCPSSQLTS